MFGDFRVVMGDFDDKKTMNNGAAPSMGRKQLSWQIYCSCTYVLRHVKSLAHRGPISRDQHDSGPIEKELMKTGARQIWAGHGTRVVHGTGPDPRPVDPSEFECS